MRKRKAFTLIELLVVVAIIALLISILLPSLSRARELSKRLVCSSNVKGMGTAFKIYANDFSENWPTVPFNDDGADIFYTNDGTAGGNPIEIGWGDGDPIVCGNKPNRQCMSDDSTETLTVTRCLFMLVRSGDVTPKQFICPSSGDQIDPEQNIDLYYDFKDYENISYGYQVPYGPYDSRASEDIDPRMGVGGDKGPYGEEKAALPVTNDEWGAGGATMTPQTWKKYNSPNHGGRGTGEGQNVLFGDGHASFEKSPIVGIDQDNIYTLMNAPTAGAIFDDGRKSGVLPHAAASGGDDAYPGQEAFESADFGDANTDSLIYP